MTRRTQVHSVDVPDDPDVLDSPELANAIETGTLAIKDATGTERWDLPVPVHIPLPNNGSTVLRLYIQQARICPPSGEDLKVKRYVIYKLAVRQDANNIDAHPAVIERRYTDFRDLYLGLKRNYSLAIDFPNRVLMGNFTIDLIAERSAAFEAFLKHVVSHSALRDSAEFLSFLQDQELNRACQFLDERRYESAVPILEMSFRLLNKVFMDRSKPVLLALCRLVAATTASSVPDSLADYWASLALSRYDTVCDIDLLALYIPLLHTCEHLWWQRGRDQQPITDRIAEMAKRGITIKGGPTLLQAIQKLDPR